MNKFLTCSKFLSRFFYLLTNPDITYNNILRMHKYRNAAINANIDPIIMGSTAPKVKAMPRTKPRIHSDL